MDINNNNKFSNEMQRITNSVMDSNNNNVLATDLLLSVSICGEVNKAKISSLAVAAAVELRQMAEEEQRENSNREEERPLLWLFDEVQNLEVLNVAEYRRRFISVDETLEEVIKLITMGGDSMNMDLISSFREDPYSSGDGFSKKNISGLTMDRETASSFPINEQDTSRTTAFVYADPLTLVHMLMNVDQWCDVFCNIVSKASSLGFLSTGADIGNPDGALQVVRAVVHVPFPLVRTWELLFARYCRQLANNTWLVTDVSLESIVNDIPFPPLDLQRRPSGCLIQGLHEGISKVTWVENIAVDRTVIPDTTFRLKVTSGFALSSKRWIATLVRHYDRNSLMQQQFHQSAEPKDNRGNAEIMSGRITPALRLDVTGRNNLLKLATRMVRNYTASVSSCAQNLWLKLPITGGENTLVKTNINMDDPGVPQGVAVTIASSIRLNFPQVDIFNFLSDGQSRSKWDMLSRGRVTREVERLSCGRDPANWISVVLTEPKGENIGMLYLQETFSDGTGLYVVHAPIDMAAMDHVASGKNSDLLAILPCGFVILPDTGGSILTIAFQILDEEASFPEHMTNKSVFTAHQIIMTTVNLIKDELSFIRKN